MRIRNKITLWIAGAGFFASLVFSLIIFVEMKELSYNSIDAELEAVAQTVKGYEESIGLQADVRTMGRLRIDTRRYWLKLYDSNMRTLYRTNLTRYVDLPLYNKGSGYTVRKTISKSLINLGQDPTDEVTFRVKTINIRVRGLPYIIQIGKPIEKLDEEIGGLIRVIAGGLTAATLVLIILSYILAGRILKPIGEINRLARDISDRTLDRRIPLGQSRDELHDLSESLNHMFDRLQYSFAMQKRFIGDAAHELKSPITLLLLFIEDSIHRKDLPDRFRDRLVAQAGVLRRMSRLVKNLLDISALELKETLEFEQFDLVGLLGSVLEDYQEAFYATRIGVVTKAPKEFQIRGDREKLHRVLINLVDNAIKYNDEGGKIEVEIHGNEREVAFSVWNTGKGIPESDFNKVFEQFYRVEKSRSPRYGGSGLGLTIAKRIVELHGGRIEIKSEPGAWTRVLVTLPKSYQG